MPWASVRECPLSLGTIGRAATLVYLRRDGQRRVLHHEAFAGFPVGGRRTERVRTPKGEPLSCGGPPEPTPRAKVKLSAAVHGESADCSRKCARLEAPSRFDAEPEPSADELADVA